MPKTGATIFSGGEGVGVGMRQAGITHLWGVEWDDAIASVARANGFHTLTGDVRDADLMRSLPRPDILHASPVCKNASNAKADGEESPLDIETADATCAYIDHFKPDVFTLENVWGYRTFESFAHILICLKRNGYHVDYWHLNAADYGVPQTRKRLILVAALHFKPVKPIATHAKPDKLTPLFDARLPWVGWYEAIADLIDTLPESKFAAWQLERLPEVFTTSLINTVDTVRESTVIDGHDPSYTIRSSAMRRPITTPQAFIVDGQNGSHEIPTTRIGTEPVFAQTVYSVKHPSPLAVIVTDQSSSAGKGIQVLESDEPSTALRSFESGGNQPRVWLSSGRVVKMTPRALARFQSIPDSYILPDKAKLACTVIGNSVPPLLYQRVAETFTK